MSKRHRNAGGPFVVYDPGIGITGSLNIEESSGEGRAVHVSGSMSIMPKFQSGAGFSSNFRHMLEVAQEKQIDGNTPGGIAIFGANGQTGPGRGYGALGIYSGSADAPRELVITSGLHGSYTSDHTNTADIKFATSGTDNETQRVKISQIPALQVTGSFQNNGNASITGSLIVEKSATSDVDWALHTKRGAGSHSAYQIKLENADASGTAAPFFGLFHQDDGDFTIGEAHDDYKLHIQNDGKIGIGVSDPDQKLEVAGAIHVSGEVSSPSAPADGDGGILYVKSDGKPYWISNEASETDLTGAAAPLALTHASSQGSPQLRIHESDAGYGRLEFQNTADTSGPNSLSHEWTLAGLPKAQGSQADARFNIFYGDQDGSGTGADLLSATGVGNILMPHTCFVSVRPNTDILNMPINATQTIIFNGEHFDNQAAYNTSDGIFTAPVTGYYLSNLQIALKQIDTGFTYMYVGVESTGTPQFGCFQRYNVNDFSADTVTYAVTRSGSTIFKLDAGDTLKVIFRQEGGTQQTDVAGQTNGASTTWQIRLIG